MSRKTRKITIAALSAATILTLASAEVSGAFAQEEVNAGAPEVANETVASPAAPTFVSDEVVQAVPETPEIEEVEAPAAPSASSLRDLVKATPTDFALSEQMQCLAGAVYFESRGEPLTGQLAVAKVVMNRSEDRRFPASYCGVVYQKAQFSFVKNGRMPRIRTGSAAWKRAKAIARIAHEDQWDSAAQDSLYFHAKYVRPAWSRRKAPRATINSHIFYR